MFSSNEKRMAKAIIDFSKSKPYWFRIRQADELKADEIKMLSEATGIECIDNLGIFTAYVAAKDEIIDILEAERAGGEVISDNEGHQYIHIIDPICRAMESTV